MNPQNKFDTVCLVHVITCIIYCGVIISFAEVAESTKSEDYFKGGTMFVLYMYIQNIMYYRYTGHLLPQIVKFNS